MYTTLCKYNLYVTIVELKRKKKRRKKNRKPQPPATLDELSIRATID